jgi:predicted RNA-binding protein YlxR (DUF448 family)
MRWNKRAKVERPEYPKLIAISATAEEAQALLTALLQSDAQAEIVSGGERGAYVRVHNEAAEKAAKQFAETRSFPLA